MSLFDRIVEGSKEPSDPILAAMKRLGMKPELVNGKTIEQEAAETDDGLPIPTNATTPGERTAAEYAAIVGYMRWADGGGDRESAKSEPENEPTGG